MDKELEKIFKGCCKNDRKSQSDLYSKHSAMLMFVCLRYLKDKSLAEDALIDSFVKIFDKITTVKDPDYLVFWMRRVTINTCLTHLRKRKSLKFVEIDTTLEFIGHEDPTSEMELKELLSYLNELPNGFREVFNLYVIDGYSHKEIAKQLKIKESTSRTQLMRARLRLQEIIGKKYDYELV